MAIRRVAVFCGASRELSQEFFVAISNFGEMLAQKKLELVYGGGRQGLMGALAESVLNSGGHVKGVMPKLLNKKEVVHSGLSELIVAENMHVRKRTMFELSDAFVAFPGGLGTLDEMVEIITWKQLGKHNKKIVLVNLDGYWNSLIHCFENMIDHKAMRESDRGLFEVVVEVEEVFEKLGI